MSTPKPSTTIDIATLTALRDFMSGPTVIGGPIQSPVQIPEKSAFNPAWILALLTTAGFILTLIATVLTRTDAEVDDQVRLTQQVTQLATTQTNLQAQISQLTKNVSDLTSILNEFMREPRFTREDYRSETAALRAQVDRNTARLDDRTDLIDQTKSRLNALEVQTYAPDRRSPPP